MAAYANFTHVHTKNRIRDTREDDGLYLCHLQRGTSDLPREQSGVSRACFIPKYPHNQSITIANHLVYATLRQQKQWMMSWNLAGRNGPIVC